MSLDAPSLRPSRVGPAGAAWRTREQRLILATWAALFINVLPYYSLPVLVPIPGRLAQLVTQGSLVLALGLALTLNPRARVRPTLFLLLFSLLVAFALMTSLHNEFLVGSAYRAIRFLVVLTVMWLLTPSWGRSDTPLLSAHVKCLTFIVGTVVIGLLLAPGAALSYGGRLSGALWPIPPTQVAHYAAVLMGLVLIGWLVGETAAKWAALAFVVCGAVLLATHTRTALLALIVGLGVAVASSFLGHARVRRVSVVTLTVALIGTLLFAPVIGTWLLRGQSVDQVGLLTGRTLVWQQVVSLPRGFLGTLVGSGPSNGSFSGLPIDSNWVATFLDAGLLGVCIQVLAVGALLVTAAVRERSRSRACALFLIVYFVTASFTESGLNGPTSYFLDLTVAASLLARPMTGRAR